MSLLRRCALHVVSVAPLHPPRWLDGPLHPVHPAPVLTAAGPAASHPTAVPRRCDGVVGTRSVRVVEVLLIGTLSVWIDPVMNLARRRTSCR